MIEAASEIRNLWAAMSPATLDNLSSSTRIAGVLECATLKLANPLKHDCKLNSSAINVSKIDVENFSAGLGMPGNATFIKWTAIGSCDAADVNAV